MIPGEVSSEEDERLAEFGRAVRTSSIPAVNEYLGRLVTLTTALIGGGFAAARTDTLPLWACVPAVVLLFAALSVALGGVRPRHRAIDFGSLADLARLEADTLGEKDRAVRWATRLFAAAVAVALLGFVAKATPR